MDWKIWDGMKLFCKTEHVVNSTFTLLSFQHIQGDSWLVDITAEGDFLGLCDKKS